MSLPAEFERPLWRRADDRGMNFPATSWKSPVKGTPLLCLQSASADLGTFSRGIPFPGAGAR